MEINTEELENMFWNLNRWVTYSSRDATEHAETEWKRLNPLHNRRWLLMVHIIDFTDGQIALRVVAQLLPMPVRCTKLLQIWRTPYEFDDLREIQNLKFCGKFIFVQRPEDSLHRRAPMTCYQESGNIFNCCGGNSEPKDNKHLLVPYEPRTNKIICWSNSNTHL